MYNSTGLKNWPSKSPNIFSSLPLDHNDPLTCWKSKVIIEWTRVWSVIYIYANLRVISNKIIKIIKGQRHKDLVPLEIQLNVFFPVAWRADKTFVYDAAVLVSLEEVLRASSRVPYPRGERTRDRTHAWQATAGLGLAKMHKFM